MDDALARSTINKNISRIKLLFRWATQNELVPANVLHGLQAVAGLRRGRSAARETEDVKPVPIGIVEQTIPYLPPVVKDIVDLLLLTGMRVGECCVMRASDIDTTGDIWLYRPERHKNLFRGQHRTIPIGPKGQAIVKNYLKPTIDAYLFSPAEQDHIIKELKRAARKTPLFPSHVAHQAAKRKARKPAVFSDVFDTDTINRSICRACKKADVPTWHTHQLRHTAALEISRQHGLEAARAVLGHKGVQMSAHYSGIDTAMASEVMGKIG